MDGARGHASLFCWSPSLSRRACQERKVWMPAATRLLVSTGTKTPAAGTAANRLEPRSHYQISRNWRVEAIILRDVPRSARAR